MEANSTNRQPSDAGAPDEPVPAGAPARPSTDPARSHEPPAPARNPRLFTADEIPTPPEWMRRPPGEVEADESGLFSGEEPE